jgi:2-amino-4-hydroxy-6-hydroxymethyldihydropteridine diphosphokinase
LELEAGRRNRGRNAARPLDLDLIDMGGRVVGSTAVRPQAGHNLGVWAARRRNGRMSRTDVAARGFLTLPHPLMHKRRFVLEPMLDVAPDWFHPVLKVSARQLLARLPKRPGEIRRALDSGWLSCDKQT